MPILDRLVDRLAHRVVEAREKRRPFLLGALPSADETHRLGRLVLGGGIVGGVSPLRPLGLRACFSAGA
jgi:hypothetical protein